MRHKPSTACGHSVMWCFSVGRQLQDMTPTAFLLDLDQLRERVGQLIYLAVESSLVLGQRRRFLLDLLIGNRLGVAFDEYHQVREYLFTQFTCDSIAVE